MTSAPGSGCLGSATITVNVEPAPILLVHVSHFSEEHKEELRPFVPPFHGRPLVPSCDDEFRLCAAVVYEHVYTHETRKDPHYVAVVSEGPPSVVDLTGEGDNTACLAAAGVSTCALPGCRSSTVGTLLRIDDHRVSELGDDDDGKRLAAWCGVTATGRGSATAPVKVPTLLAYLRC